MRDFSEMGNLGGLEFPGEYARFVAMCFATAEAEKEKKQGANAVLRRAAAETKTSMAGAGEGGRISWKNAAAEREAEHKERNGAMGF